MLHPVTRTLSLALAAVLSTAVAGAQVFSTPSAPAPNTATTPVAHLYVQTTKGVNAYTVTSTGKLTLISGSPFKTRGLMLGTAGGHFVTEGTSYLHSYKMTSTGGIGAEASQIDLGLYQGAECGPTFGGTIDRTGNEVYIQNQSGAKTCASVQAFKVNTTTGAFTLDGVAETTGVYIETPLVLAGNNKHADTLTTPDIYNAFTAFYRNSSGAMNNDYPTIQYPPPPAYGGSYYPMLMASDNQNMDIGHMAVAMHLYDTYGDFEQPALASYTIDEHGDLTFNGPMMPTLVYPMSMAINPEGNLLAVGGTVDDPTWCCVDGPGLQVFHFNGAKPITGYSNVLTSDPIDSVAWDKSHHLFASSKSTNKLYVYTITPTSITPVAGSPFILSGPSTLVVRPL